MSEAITEKKEVSSGGAKIGNAIRYDRKMHS